MNKLTIAVFTLLFAVLGGCASTGEMIGTSGNGYDASGPFPHEVVVHAGG
jgi:hypothetical protein